MVIYSKKGQAGQEKIYEMVLSAEKPWDLSQVI
jgi:hypothetical protein